MLRSRCTTAAQAAQRIGRVGRAELTTSRLSDAHHQKAVYHLRSGLITRPGQRSGQIRTSLEAGATGDQSPSLLTRIVNISSVPYTSFVPKPHTFLHDISAEMKQLWAVGILVLMSRSSLTFRILVVAFITLISILSLEKRLWAPQLLRVGGLCGILFLFTALGSDTAPPILSDRAPTNISPNLLDPPFVSETLGSSSYVPKIDVTSMKDVFFSGRGYRYVVLWLGPFTITKRSLSLAITLSSLTFVALQTASLCLVSTPPERMALAIGRALKPLAVVGVPVKELVLTVLLSLRFIATVFEEARNLCLGLASRGIDWSLMGWSGSLNEMLRVAVKLFNNLFSRSEAIAAAMVARGFVGPNDHLLYVDSKPAGRSPSTSRGWHFTMLPNVLATFLMVVFALLAKRLV